MNAEAEMNASDGLGGERLNPCAQIAESVGYSAYSSCEMDSLIDYKNALEDALRRALDENRQTDAAAARAAHLIAAGVPRFDEWKSAADFMQDVASTLDNLDVPRPDHYEEV